MSVGRASGSRPVVLAANWKMHHGPAAARSFAHRFRERVSPAGGCRCFFFTPAVSLAAAVEGFGGRSDIAIGAQNVHWEPKGAFTGELSVPLMQEVGATAALVGHSERRHLFGETEEQTAKKVAALLAAGCVPMLCVGETLAEREEGRTGAVVLRQLSGALDQLPADQLRPLLIAYEPVWAIGTGRNATPDDAAQVHRLIRNDLAHRGLDPRTPVLYGGSVNAKNVTDLLSQEEIDGVLVGGASLDADGWAGIVELARRARAG